MEITSSPLAPSTSRYIEVYTGDGVFEVSYWVADEQRPSGFQVLAQAPYDGSGGWSQFWFEFNSSQSRGGEEAYAWGRNIAILRDLALSEAASLIP